MTPLSTLANIASLTAVLSEKQDALKNRKAPRDVFDYWYINLILIGFISLVAVGLVMLGAWLF